MPVEAARSRFLQIIVDHFIGQHLIEKRGACLENTVEHGEDKLNKRKSGEVQYEGDPRFALPLMYVANLYETLVNEVNLRIASLNGLRDKTIGVALEASGGLYRKLTQKFPKTGKRRLEPGETSTKQFGKVGKSGAKMHCSHCGGEGHNKQTWSQRQPKLKVIPHLN